RIEAASAGVMVMSARSGSRQRMLPSGSSSAGPSQAGHVAVVVVMVSSPVDGGVGIRLLPCPQARTGLGAAFWSDCGGLDDGQLAGVGGGGHHQPVLHR